MIKLIRRVSHYVTALLTGKFNEIADPKVQLEQAIIEAQEQHRRLKEQAANVIANQKQTEMRLERSMEELEQLNARAKQALIMADDASKAHDETKATDYTRAAESFASKLIAIEAEIASLKELHLQSTKASDQAKAAVQENSVALQKKLSEKQKLLSQLDQAKMHEQLNSAMDTINESVGQDVPTFAEVQEKIEARYAKAQGTSELRGESVESRMAEVETAARNTDAKMRLEQLKGELGLRDVAVETEPLSTSSPTETRPGESSQS